MELRQLRHAIALAETRNFARAAENQCISQPALTRSIQALESSLGVTLFDRDNRNVCLNKDGIEFIKHAKEIIQRSDHLKREISLRQGLETGDVVVGLGPYVTATYGAQLVSEVTRKNPGIDIRIKMDNWINLAKLLREERIDFFIADIRDINRTNDLIIETIIEHDVIAICRAGHPIIEKEPLSFHDLKNYPLAATKLPYSVRRFFIDTRIAVETDNVLLLKEIVKSSDLISFSTWPLAYKDIEEGTLHKLELKQDPGLITNCGIVRLKNRSLSRASQLFIKLFNDIDSDFKELD